MQLYLVIKYLQDFACAYSDIEEARRFHYSWRYPTTIYPMNVEGASIGTKLYIVTVLVEGSCKKGLMFPKAYLTEQEAEEAIAEKLCCTDCYDCDMATILEAVVDGDL